MAAPMKRVVGCLNRCERELVFQELYSNDSVQQRHAIDKIAVWKSRVLHKLSTAIHCSWQLVAAQLQERQAVTEGMLGQQTEQLRMLYAMALLRFINLLTERGQTKAYPIPVHVIAEELGVPEWIVDLRHDAAHSSLPSLTLLRSGAHFAMDWLRREYWEAQLSEDPSGGSPYHSSQTASDDDSSQGRSTATAADVADALVNYIDQMFMLTEKKKGLTEKKSEEKRRSKEDHKSLNQVVSQLERIIVRNKREKAVDLLVQDGYLCSTHEQLDALDITQEDLDTPDLVLPPTYIMFWKPVLRLFHSLKLTPLLLQTLLTELTEEDCLRNRLLVGWAATILNAIDLADQDLYKKAHPYHLYNTSFDIPEKLLLKWCAQIPSELSARLLTQLLGMCSDIPCAQRDQLTKLCNIYTGCNISGKEHVPTNIHKLDRLLRVCRRKQKESDVDKNIPETSTCDWKLYDGHIDWSQVPIGCCPGTDVESMDCKSLELPHTVNRLLQSPDSDSTTQRNNTSLSDHVHAESEDTMHTEGKISGSQDTSVHMEGEDTNDHWSLLDVETLQQGVVLF